MTANSLLLILTRFLLLDFMGQAILRFRGSSFNLHVDGHRCRAVMKFPRDVVAGVLFLLKPDNHSVLHIT